MFNDSDFTDNQKMESFVGVALPYDFCEHVVQQNKRDDDSRVEHRAPKALLQSISYSETCERCGKDLERVYIWNRKRLCKSCVGEGQETWVLFTGSPNAAPQRAPVQPLKKVSERLLIESLISEFLAFFGLKRIEKEISIVESKMPIKRARLRAVQRPDKEQIPKSEGIMNCKLCAKLGL